MNYNFFHGLGLVFVLSGSVLGLSIAIGFIALPDPLVSAEEVIGRICLIAISMMLLLLGGVFFNLGGTAEETPKVEKYWEDKE